MKKLHLFASLCLSIVVLFTTYNSFGQGFDVDINSDRGVLFYADHNNTHAEEDFVWIIDQNLWVNGDNSEKMRLGSWGLKLNVPAQFLGGNVGIGTSSPSQQLHVVGNGYFTDKLGIGTISPLAKLQVSGTDTEQIRLTSVNKRIYLSLGGTTPYIGTNTAHDFSIVAGNNYALTATTAGNIGIGTTSPITKLHVKDGDVLMENSKVGIGTVSPNSALHVKDGDVLMENSKVGIGTVSPHSALHIKDGDILMERGDLEFFINIDPYDSAATIGTAGEDNLEFATDLSTRMFISKTGNVGIGTVNTVRPA